MKRLSDTKPFKKSDHQAAIDYFCQRHEAYYINQATGEGVRYRVVRGKDGKIIKELLAHYGPQTLLSLIDLFFDLPDKWLDGEAERSIGTLSVRSNRLAQFLSNPNKGLAQLGTKTIQNLQIVSAGIKRMQANDED